MKRMRIMIPLVVAVLGAGLGAWAVATPAHAALAPLQIAKSTSDYTPRVYPGGVAHYEIAITNPNTGPWDIIYPDSLTDTLPPGFTYAEGMTSGFVTFDPLVAGQTLTWTFNEDAVPPNTTFFLDFEADVSPNEPSGLYCNTATVYFSQTSVTTGPTAAYQVRQEGEAAITPYCPGNQIVLRATPTFTATSPATATEVPAMPTNTPVPPPPTATQPSGGTEGIISAPNTGSGPESGGPSMLLLAIAGVMVAGGGGAAAIAARRS